MTAGTLTPVRRRDYVVHRRVTKTPFSGLGSYPGLQDGLAYRRNDGGPSGTLGVRPCLGVRIDSRNLDPRRRTLCQNSDRKFVDREDL